VLVAASQTIAKAMSAYDKDFSNAIYGPSRATASCAKAG
jgi:hypothetical protein